MKVVVTGGSGQLGTLVLERLAQKRQVKRVLSLDLVAPAVASAKIEWRIADVRDPGFDRHLEGADVLVHLAFIVTRPASPEEMTAVNVEGSRNVFEAALVAGVKKFVYSSSLAAYGIVPGHPEPIVETTPRRSGSPVPYSRNKVEVEALLDDIEAKNPGLLVTRLRPGILLGRRVSHGYGRVLARGVIPASDGAPVPLVWDEDVADAVMLAILEDRRGAFNLVADDPLPPAELALAADLRRVRVPEGALAVLGKVGGLTRLLGVDPAWLAARGVRLVASSDKARSDLGWKPSCPTAADVVRRFRREAPRRVDPRIATFVRLASLAAKRIPASQIPPEARRTTIRVHLDLTGPGGGDFDVDIAEGRLTIRPGIPRPPDGTVRMSAATFTDLLSGKGDTSTAHLTGRVRVRGEPMSGMAVDALITGFRNSTTLPGARGWSARKLSSWLGKSMASD